MFNLRGLPSRKIFQCEWGLGYVAHANMQSPPRMLRLGGKSTRIRMPESVLNALVCAAEQRAESKADQRVLSVSCQLATGAFLAVAALFRINNLRIYQYVGVVQIHPPQPNISLHFIGLGASLSRAVFFLGQIKATVGRFTRAIISQTPHSPRAFWERYLRSE